VTGDYRHVAEEHAALRRVATLVAQGAPADEVFQAVTEEAGRLVGAIISNMVRFDPGGTELTMAGWSVRGDHMPTGGRFALDGDCIDALVLSTGRPGRIDSYDGLTGEIATMVRALGIKAEVGAPVIVDGRVWGALIASSASEPLPPGTEDQVASFAELAAAAISNAEAREELLASRARIVAAADEERRRIERNLHDGAQQRLVAMTLELRTAQRGASEAVAARIERVVDGLNEVLDDVREISRGLHPVILTRAGLRPALEALARRAPMPVELEVEVEGRLPETIEIAVYYAVSEALANAGKHARADSATVHVRRSGSRLSARISDDGAGGAKLEPERGLIGLRDRIETIGGRLTLDSPPGRGTTLVVDVPIPASR
jgi:signal transduction histidine kinase